MTVWSPRGAREARTYGVTFAGAAAAFGLVVGCGVQAQEEPEPLPTQEVPGGLYTPSAPTSPAVRPDRLQVLDVYFVRDQKLQPVPRVAAGARPLDRGIEALAAGPTAIEAAGGLRSALLPTGFRVAVEGRVVVVDGDASLTRLTGEEQLLAFAQIVWTVTAVPGVDAVVVLADGGPLEAPTDGGLVSRPVRRADYASVAPQQPPG